MIEGNFFDFYFANSNSDSCVEGFDPENILSLWY